ncbi:MAG: hypothetical protein JW936_00735 [Sedimentisphaerales bacterium]|nr:hypothetical protein [Sedimentisphaerales bacterium]
MSDSKKTIVKMRLAGQEFEAELNDTSTAQAIVASLPIEALAQRWGDEFYFGTPVEHELEEGAREVLAVGEIGYWPPGKAFCVFFGPTPISVGSEPRSASAVSIIGRLRGDFSALNEIEDGSRVKLTLPED